MTDGLFYVLLTLGTGWLLFELIEHAILPLYWSISGKKPLLHHGPEVITGRSARVVHWEGCKGQVKLDGEIWRAKGKQSLCKAENVIVKKVDGLTLIVTRPED